MSLAAHRRQRLPLCLGPSLSLVGSDCLCAGLHRAANAPNALTVQGCRQPLRLLADTHDQSRTSDLKLVLDQSETETAALAMADAVVTFTWSVTSLSITETALRAAMYSSIVSSAGLKLSGKEP